MMIDDDWWWWLMMIDDDDDDCKVADEHVPLISELDDQGCKEITENVAQLDEIIEESAKKESYIFMPKNCTCHWSENVYSHVWERWHDETRLCWQKAQAKSQVFWN